MCTNKRTPYNKTCPALPWQYLGASVSLRTISRRTGCGKTSHQQVPLPCKTKNLHLKSRVGANSPAPCLTSAMDRETRGFTCPMHLQQLASHTQIYIYIHVIIWGLLFRGGGPASHFIYSIKRWGPTAWGSINWRPQPP